MVETRKIVYVGNKEDILCNVLLSTGKATSLGYTSKI